MLQYEVKTVFEEGGLLSQHVSGFRARPAQVEMANAVAEAINDCQTLVAEAGTGTGKTFAYLVPALLSGGKVLVSTASKTLQDQLFDKDIPLIRAALGKPVTVALLKGRANYLCHHYLQRTLDDGRLNTPKDAEHLQKIRWFAMETHSGDKADCTAVPESAPIWGWVTSTRENCLGSDCEHYQECFVVKARKEAQEADVVVVNHHLFLADTALREEGVAELLPAANTIVFDEAHQLPDIATLFFGQTVSAHQWQDLLRDILVAGRATARDAADWDQALRPLDTALKSLRAALANFNEPQRWTASRVLADPVIQKALLEVANTAERVMEVLATVADRSEEWQKFANRLADMCIQWKNWVLQETVAGSEEFVKWATLAHGSIQMHASPMDIASTFQKCREGPKRAWVFTSATLSVRNSLEHFRSSLGLDDSSVLKVWPSPFDYESQALLCVPQHAPSTTDPAFAEKLCEVVWPLVEASDGGVFYLCTTLRAVQKVGHFLREKIEQQELDWQLLIQGEAGKAEMLEHFRQASKPVLVGSASFWEGVDVKGDQLRLVIIDKLPFSPPDDPIIAARSEWVRDRGGNPFMDIHVPDAAITLKQGAGRLIRDEKDRGVLVIGDRRLVEKPYGRTLWQSLPPFKRTQAIQTAVEQLKVINSTPVG